MSSYWKVACRDCNKGLDLTPYTDEAVVKFIGEFVRYDHAHHSIVAFSDITDQDGSIEDSLKDVDWFEPNE